MRMRISKRMESIVLWWIPGGGVALQGRSGELAACGGVAGMLRASKEGERAAGASVRHVGRHRGPVGREIGGRGSTAAAPVKGAAPLFSGG
jgi:hypothetical protein